MTTVPTPKYIAVYDNGGKTVDRYTVVYLNQMETDTLYGARGMDEHPFHPQGFGQSCTAIPGAHLGKMIRFKDLPADCQRVVLGDLSDDQDQQDDSTLMEIGVLSEDDFAVEVGTDGTTTIQIRLDSGELLELDAYGNVIRGS